MKKFVSILACLAILLVGGVFLASCGQENYITVPKEKVSIADVEFSNDGSFKLTSKEDNHYIAEGKASVMTEAQAKAWGTETGSKYVIVSVKAGKDSQAIFGWKESAKADEAFKETEIDGNSIKKKTVSDETEEFVLALTDGETPRHPNATTWRVEITGKDEEKSTAYTIDFSNFYKTDVEK